MRAGGQLALPEPSRPMNALVLRSDASASQGTGHVMRCLALALALRERGVVPVMASAECPEALVERIRSAGVRVVRMDEEVGSAEDAAATLRIAREEGAEWVLTDGYRFDLAYQRALRGGRVRLAVIDDRREEHTSELQSQRVISYAVLCLKKKRKIGRAHV